MVDSQLAATRADPTRLVALLQRAVDTLALVYESLPAHTYPNARREVDEVMREAREVLE